MSTRDRAQGGRVLVVQRDASVRRSVAAALREAGFVAHEAGSARGAEAELRSFRPDLVVLDVVLPDADGFGLARTFGETLPRTPVIFLTAQDSPADAVTGLAVADDFVSSPFSHSEVVARVRAVLRRTRRDDAGVLRYADVVLDEVTHEVRRRGCPVPLTPREFALLRFFVRNAERVVSREQVLANVWVDPAERGTASVETYVSYLRRKLDVLGPPLLHTVRRVGYVLRELC